MALPPTLAYDWSTKPQDCLAVLEEARATIDKQQTLQGDQKAKCRFILTALSAYLENFKTITNHRLLKNKSFYTYTDKLQKLDKSIADLWKNSCFRACLLTSVEMESPPEELPPEDVTQWLEEKHAGRVISYLNSIVQSQMDDHQPDLHTAEKIKAFYQKIKDFISPLEPVLCNPVIIHNTPLGKLYPNEKSNPFFKAVIVVNVQISIDGLVETLKSLNQALRQTDELINAHSSPNPSPVASPVSGIPPAHPKMGLARLSLANRLAALEDDRPKSPTRFDTPQTSAVSGQAADAAKPAAPPAPPTQPTAPKATLLPKPIKITPTPEVKSGMAKKIVATVVVVAIVAGAVFIIHRQRQQKPIFFWPKQ